MIYFIHVQKRNYNYYLSLKFIIFICLKKKIFLNYNRCKLLTFTKKKKIEKHLCTRMSAYSEASVVISY